MKAIIIALTLLLPATVQANSTTRYDRSLEQAAADIIAEKIGEIRGGFRHNEKPEFVAGSRQNSTERLFKTPNWATHDNVWQDGLAPARGVPQYRRGNI